MEYIYPAVFHTNDDGTYTITYPNLPGCISEGKSLGNALFMAENALTQWIEHLSENKMRIPDAPAINEIEVDEGEFVNLIRAEVKDSRAVKRTVSIPKWMDEKVAENRLSLSRVLQDALSEKFSSV